MRTGRSLRPAPPPPLPTSGYRWRSTLRASGCERRLSRGRVLLAAKDPHRACQRRTTRKMTEMAHSDEGRLGQERPQDRPQDRPILERPPQEQRSDPERWLRVKDRLRAEVGEDIFTSWFARMELDTIEGETVRLSVATRFLKTWIQSHYGEKVLLCCQGEIPALRRIDIVVRSAVIRSMSTPVKAPEP